jgi:hypothetical protein
VTKTYYTFDELYPEWIPFRAARITVNRWIDDGTFPAPDRISANRLAWDTRKLLQFRATRPAPGEPVPVLWPAQVMPRGRGQHGRKQYFGKGRPRGSKVIGGRVVRAEDVPAALAAVAGGDDPIRS